MENDVFYKSKTKLKRESRLLEQESFMKQKREREAMESLQKRWNDAQIKAASAQSVLNYMVQVFTENKAELTEEQVKETEEQINIRKKDIEEFLMTAKDTYTQALKDFNASL